MKNIITYSDPKSVISEEFRAIRTSMQYSNLDKKIKTILVTSTTKNEGKTTTTSNLAVSFAKVDNKKVLVIDCDLRNPSIHKAFGISNIKGLSDLLIEGKSILNYIKPTQVENLHIITAGAVPPNPAEVLASNAMQEFIQNIKEEYDYVFIDTPPIGMVTDAGILASFIDGTVLVVRSEMVDINKVQESKKKLNSVNANILGAILNRKKVRNDDYYYSYYGLK